jgi:hypothetical protein
MRGAGTIRSLSAARVDDARRNLPRRVPARLFGYCSTGET